MKNAPNYKNTPQSNTAQNKQFNDATKGLTNAQKDIVHRQISKQDMSFKEIQNIAKQVASGKLH